MGLLGPGALRAPAPSPAVLVLRQRTPASGPVGDELHLGRAGRQQLAEVVSLPHVERHEHRATLAVDRDDLAAGPERPATQQGPAEPDVEAADPPLPAHPVAQQNVEVGVLEWGHDERGVEPFGAGDVVVEVVADDVGRVYGRIAHPVQQRTLPLEDGELHARDDRSDVDRHGQYRTKTVSTVFTQAPSWLVSSSDTVV